MKNRRVTWVPEREKVRESGFAVKQAMKNYCENSECACLAFVRLEVYCTIEWIEI